MDRKAENQGRNASPEQELQRALGWFLVLLASMWAASLLVLAVTRAHHLPPPYNTLLFARSVRFSDWTNFTPRATAYPSPNLLLRADLGGIFPYPLPSFYLFVVPTHLTTHPLRLFLEATLLILAVFAGGAVLLLSRRPAWRSTVVCVAAAVAFGFPVWFLIDRGNVEIFIWLFVWLGLVCFCAKRHNAAALLWALAGSMKIYPALLLMLLFARKKYGSFLLGVTSVAATTAFSIWNIGDLWQTTQQAMHQSAKLLNDAYIEVLPPPNIRFDHSLLALMITACIMQEQSTIGKADRNTRNIGSTMRATAFG